jgi:hypothetical protein
MSKSIAVEGFTKELFEILDETFEHVHGIYLDKGTSLFETLETITAARVAPAPPLTCACCAALRGASPPHPRLGNPCSPPPALRLSPKTLTACDALLARSAVTHASPAELGPSSLQRSCGRVHASPCFASAPACACHSTPMLRFRSGVCMPEHAHASLPQRRVHARARPCFASAPACACHSTRMLRFRTGGCMPQHAHASLPHRRVHATARPCFASAPACACQRSERWDTAQARGPHPRLEAARLPAPALRLSLKLSPAKHAFPSPMLAAHALGVYVCSPRLQRSFSSFTASTCRCVLLATAA